MSDWQHEFPLDPDVHYLNHAAVAPWPRRATEAVQALAEENLRRGASDYKRWLGREIRLREQLARLINAPGAAPIALLKNTSEALSVVAHGLPWRDGDNVVISDQEFPSNRIVWESLSRYGVSVRRARLADAPTPEDAVADQMDERTRLVSVSSVQYGTGLRMDLTRLGRMCRERDVLFCVDAIQSIGALAMDVQAIHADFAMADGHKWMLGPEGLALFYCAERHLDMLQLYQYGWHMTAEYDNFDSPTWSPAPNGRRFECGSPNMLGVFALSASVELLLETGMENVEREVLAKARFLMDGLRSMVGVQIITPTESDRHGGIVTFRVANADHRALLGFLVKRGIVCAQRGGGIRFSPHFHTRQSTLDAALDAVREWIG